MDKIDLLYNCLLHMLYMVVNAKTYNLYQIYNVLLCGGARCMAVHFAYRLVMYLCVLVLMRVVGIVV